MEDTIKREDAIKALTEVLFDEPPYLNSIEKCETFARKTLKDIPSAENKGEWIFQECFDEFYGRAYECSICGVAVVGNHHNFCPNCGARMVK